MWKVNYCYKLVRETSFKLGMRLFRIEGLIRNLDSWDLGRRVKVGLVFISSDIGVFLEIYRIG